MDDEKMTLVRVSKKNRDKLYSFGKARDSLDDCLSTVIKKAEGYKNIK